MSDAALPTPTIRRPDWPMLSLALALVIQFAGVIWFASGLERRTTALEQTTSPLRDGTVARLDERTKAIEGGVRRIEDRLDRIGGAR